MFAQHRLPDQVVLPGLLMLGLAACVTRPELIEDRPLNLASLDTSPVQFAWHVQGSGSEEFTGYRLQVAGSVDFANLVHDEVHREPKAAVVLPPGTYYWRVQGMFRGASGATETTEWSDMKLVDGRYTQRVRSISILDGGTATQPASTTPEAPPAAPAQTLRGTPPPSGPVPLARTPTARPAPAAPGALRPGTESVVPAHTNRPALDGVDTIGVALVTIDGQDDMALTRELVLRLYELNRYTLLEQQLVPDGELRVPLDLYDAGGKPKEPPPERARVYLLHRSQPTPMLADNAVRLKSPDAMLVVRIGRLAFDPSLLPRRPAPPTSPRPDFGRFESGTRVLNATLVSLKTGIIIWTTSLYGMPDLPDMALLSSLVDTYFR